MELADYDPEWATKYQKEAEFLNALLEDDIEDMQHIGSTAVPGLRAKPIIDIAILASQYEYLQSFVQTLKRAGYQYYPESSSVERLFFRKGDPVEFHLSVTQEGKTTYWERQLVFRDTLIARPEFAREYEQLKQQLLHIDPEAGQMYSDGKSEFIKRVLAQSGNQG